MNERAKERWRRLWARLGAETSGEKIFNRLMAAYAEPHRRYHNGDHVRQCLVDFDRIRTRLDDPDTVEAAIWFHRRKRHAILGAFIRRPAIYQTAHFRRKFESRARENIARVLAGK